MLLLDTTFLVDAERGAGELESMIGDDDDVAIAAITVAELFVGIELATTRHRPAREEYVDEILSTIPVLGYDVAVAAEHAILLGAVRKAGRPRGAHDLMIAATARATNRTVVTADATAFVDLPGVAIEAHR